MKIYVSARSRYFGQGTKEAPYRTITEAAKVAVAGDEIWVAPGIYRESVKPVRGGSSDICRITYRSQIPGKAVITGAEIVKNWKRYQDNVWVARIPNSIFGTYNPYTVEIKGDWFFSKVPIHTGEIYLNGKALYETESLVGVLNSEENSNSWDFGFSVYKWYTCQDGKDTVIYANFQDADPNREIVEINVRRTCFLPDKTGVDYITLSGFSIRQAATQWAPPTAYQDGMVGPHWSKGWIIEDCEISDSRCSGISLGKYLQPNNENKNSTTHLKDGTQNERDAVCQALNEGWKKENIGSHIVRRCNIHDCGQTGIVGHLGGVFSIIEDNHIHHINCKQELSGAEIGGIKMHAPIDVIIRRNHIHHCTRGIWLDWQAQGTRISRNLFHDNIPPEGVRLEVDSRICEDIFVEVSHGPTLIDNNMLLSPCSARLSTQGVAFVHNLIAGSLTAVGTGGDNGCTRFATPRYTPYHVPHRTELAGFMTILHGDVRFYNNIFIQQEIRRDLEEIARERREKGMTGFVAAPNFYCGTKPYDGYPTGEAYFSNLLAPSEVTMFGSDKYYDHLPVYTGGNVYFNGATPCDTEKDAYVDAKNEVYISLQEREGAYTLNTNLYEYLPKLVTPFVSTELLGEAFEPEQRFENPDGTPIFFNSDYFGKYRGENPKPGPFEITDTSAECFPLFPAW